MTRPQYWRGYAEREASPEFQVALESEFGEEASPSTLGEPTRRGFLGLVSAALAGGSLAGCVRRPEQRIMPYSKAPEDLLPGVPQRYATATHLAGEVIGLLVESHEGRPTKLEGNPDHPTSGGGTNALQQGWIFDLYDPTRLT
ncbi:TAT-variant-translocated molybdopterin oxidoreductase, partial [Myxococcota bacterium]|nr:TAT-variant-translocated molybdopterin oxidoreductase [Myxococcota bacterium]